MSFGDDLLVVLSSYHGGYSLMKARMRGYDGPSIKNSSKHFNDASAATVRTTLYRLRKRGLVEGKDGLWKLTKRGIIYTSNKLNFHQNYEIKSNSPKNMIISFDIPEKQKNKRNWLRAELINLGFSLLHKSVWFGPAPLPEEFTKSIKELNLFSHMKFFKAEEWDVV